MKRRGENTRPAQRRVNLRFSLAKLEDLLEVNFQSGAQMVTLTYREGSRKPSRDLAELQLKDWLHAVRSKSGQQLHYIRSTERESARKHPVHRVVLAPPVPSTSVLTALWEYGAVTAQPVEKGGQKAIAALLMGLALQAGRVLIPGSRVWSPSRGLIRSRKDAENE